MSLEQDRNPAPPQLSELSSLPLPSLPPYAPVHVASLPPGTTIQAPAPPPAAGLLLVDRAAELAAVIGFLIWGAMRVVSPETAAAIVVLLLARSRGSGAALGSTSVLGSLLASVGKSLRPPADKKG